MKLCVCIVHNRDKGKITEELVRAGFKFTVIGSTGGFLREGNTTILIGVDDADLPGLQRLIGQNCSTREQLVNVSPFEAGLPGSPVNSPIKVPVGGAVVFVLNVEQFERY